MKPLLFLALLFSGLAVSAQQKLLQFNSNKLNKLKNYFKSDTTGEYFRRFENMIKQNSLLPQATFSHNTSRGKVYTMPFDNMPCLVPDMNQVKEMPQHKMPGGGMPNLIPEQPVIPRDRKEKK